MKKYSLIKESENYNFRQGDVIRYEMPSFTSGEYLAKVYYDETYGFYIDNKSNYFDGCRDWYVFNVGDEDCMDWLKEEYKTL